KVFLRKYSLHSVCEEARCPNQTYCFSKPTAAFMILGNYCTRRCAFCAVSHGKLQPPDPEEPERIAEAAKEMRLKYVVITSVTRDDLADGGAFQFAKTIRAIKNKTEAKVEVLTPDFKGCMESIKTVVDANPDVFNHNLETIENLYPTVRPEANYELSLSILKNVKEMNPNIYTKSGFMLGLGESISEVYDLLKDLKSVRCDIVTIGQYMRPTKANIPVKEYINPEIFEMLRLKGIEMGFKFVASAPLVRSSMNAEEMF
ncbi:MAG: lipoyl synthase, partial [Thermodesulfovibrionales bacterium]|nr:lipoyl synthase [Thermodesulfovibrionales bacterium]